jgi:hypothetical protein
VQLGCAPWRIQCRDGEGIGGRLCPVRTMSRLNLHPMVRRPFNQNLPWGGRRLGEPSTARVPKDGPCGKAWTIGDRKDTRLC